MNESHENRVNFSSSALSVDSYQMRKLAYLSTKLQAHSKPKLNSLFASDDSTRTGRGGHKEFLTR